MSTIMQIPAPLNKYLRDYQQQGVRFLYSHYVHGKGAVLCDDMGLGKTVQVHVYKPCSNTRIHVRIMYSYMLIHAVQYVNTREGKAENYRNT